MASKSGDWYKALRESDPDAYRKLMDDKYATRVEQLNTDPTKFAQMKFTKQRAGAKERKLAWDLNQEHVHKLIKETKRCYISGRKLVMEVNHPDGPSLDRLDASKGYHADNVVVTSQLINKARGEMSVEEFVKMCRDVVEFHDVV
jgi:hypothetical protein